VIVASSSSFTAGSTLAVLVGFGGTSDATSVEKLVWCHLEAFCVDLGAHPVVVSFVGVLLAKSLLQLIDFIGAPLVLHAVVFDQLVKTSITLSGREVMPPSSAFCVFSPAYSPLSCVNRPAVLTDRRFTPLCLGRNTSSVSVLDRVLSWGPALACIDCGTFALKVGWAGLGSVHWQVFATRLQVQGVAQLTILLL